MTKWVIDTHTAEKDDRKRDDGGPPGTKVLRLLFVVGTRFICTAAINKWRELERKSLQRKEQESDLWPDDNSAIAVQKAVKWSFYLTFDGFSKVLVIKCLLIFHFNGLFFELLLCIIIGRGRVLVLDFEICILALICSWDFDQEPVWCRIPSGSYVLCRIQRVNSGSSNSFETI